MYRPKDRDIWWIKYRRAGKAYYESSESTRKGDAIELLKKREGDIAHGKPVTSKMGRIQFEEAADDLLNDYRINNKRSIAVVQRRVEKHLAPYFCGCRMANVTTADVRAFVAHRQKQGVVAVKGKRKGERIGDVSAAEINRELALLKRMFTLALQAGKLLHRPHIPLLAEHNVRVGFFEHAQLEATLARLPEEIQPVIRFAAITGWRIDSEVLRLEWRNVDFGVGEVRLDRGTTKNGEGRTFPFTAELRALLEEQDAERERLKKAGHIIARVFFRMVAEGRGGEKKPRPITSFGKAWKTACRAAGCPGRIPHDLRRTAIRNLVRAGISERVAMELSGHKTPSVFARYDITSASDLQDAARKLDATRTSRPATRGA
ncbi:MAG: site-specific integrase [Cyanobacteria bacterium]|nr:site-specific integrase [Cyanobacteriota bacterium]